MKDDIRLRPAEHTKECPSTEKLGPEYQFGVPFVACACHLKCRQRIFDLERRVEELAGDGVKDGMDERINQPEPVTVTDEEDAAAKALWSYLRAGYPTESFPGYHTPNQQDFWRRAVLFVRANASGESPSTR